jgi:hypothetical protein
MGDSTFNGISILLCTEFYWIKEVVIINKSINNNVRYTLYCSLI